MKKDVIGLLENLRYARWNRIFGMRSSKSLFTLHRAFFAVDQTRALGLAFLGVALVKPKSVANRFTTIHCQQQLRDNVIQERDFRARE